MPDFNEEEIYKPNYSCKGHALLFIILVTSIFLAILLSSRSCIIQQIAQTIVKQKEEITCEDIVPIIIFFIIIIDYIILCAVLTIIIVTDDRGIKFAKLNELKRIHKKFTDFNNSYEVVEETINLKISKDNDSVFVNKNDREVITKKENPRLEFYKKYMDIIAEI